MENEMVQNLLKKISVRRKFILPVVAALALLSGILVSSLSTSNAQANSYSACSNGYTGIGCPRFVVSKVHGTATVGSTVNLTVTGVGFYGDPKVTSNEPGAKFTVLHDHGTSLVIRVKVPAGAKHGTFTLTIRLANGKYGRVGYVTKPS
jgi:hypothetical protein